MKRSYVCACGQRLFFRNSQCTNCQRALGYCTETGLVEALEPAGEAGNTWRLARDEGDGARLWWRCDNLATPVACNWLLPAVTPEDESRPRLCAACGLNRTVPDWSIEPNASNWRKIELAKRRVISSVIGMGLPVYSRFTDDPQNGLAFDFLAPLDGGPPIMTGHEDGLITLNLSEADDVSREAMRKQMHEPYRTVLGHLRHEIGHYYWDVLVKNSSEWLEPFRELFGDERQDYQQALRTHYENGPPPDWTSRFISSYASSHPWEDWAESWAHYMHMVDAIDTASSIGLNIADTVIEPLADALPVPEGEEPPPARTDVSELFDDWLKLVQALNQMSRSMGQRDFYPFIVPDPARRKVEFVHRVIADCRERRMAEASAQAPAAPAELPAEAAPATEATTAAGG